MNLLQENLRSFERAWWGNGADFPLYPAPGEVPYGALLMDGYDAPHYPFEKEYPFAEAGTAFLLALADSWNGGDFSHRAPHPRPELRVRPRL
jgi:hypothetical protein